MGKRIIILIVLFTIALTGCSGGIKEQTIGGTTCANITMGNGEFAYHNGMIYFTDYFNIFEYDVETKKLVGFNSNNTWVKNIAVSEDRVYFNSSGLCYMTKDGKTQKTEFRRDGMCVNLYIEGDTAFFLDGIGGDFITRDINSGTETVVHSEINNYYIDTQNIWLLNKNNTSTVLKCYDREMSKITNIDLSFSPVAVVSYGNDAFLSKSETFQLVRITNGIETAMPINAYFYQVVNDKLIFLDENTFKNSCYSLKSYDLCTGETKLLYEKVFSFNILENRYICVHIGTSDEKYAFYDLETKQKMLMYDKATKKKQFY